MSLWSALTSSVRVGWARLVAPSPSRQMRALPAGGTRVTTIRSAPSRTAARALPPSSMTSWDVGTVKAALDEHERGNFSRSALLIDYMGRDDRLWSILMVLVLGVVRLPFSAKPGEGDARVAPAAARAFAADWWTIAPETVQIEAVTWLVMAGVALLELVWDDTGTPRLRVWHLQYLRRDQYAGKWMLTTSDGEIEIRPGDGQWVLLSLGSDRGWMAGAVRRLAKWWLIREYTSQDWHAHEEVRGGGLRKAIVPEGADDVDVERFVTAIENLGAETTVECRQNEQGKGWDVQLVDATGDASIGFERLLKRCEINYAVGLLGQDMGIEAPGVYVPARAFGKIQLDRAQAIAAILSTAWHDQVSVPWSVYHYDSETVAPWPTLDAEPPVDKSQAADVMGKVLAAVKTAQDAAIELDLQELQERYGFAMRKGASPPTQALPAAA